MEGVLEGATVLSVCKVACSLPFLRSVSCYSPVSFCCCCLLVFTDLVLTVFLCVLLILDIWQIETPSTGDAIALRALLFVAHTYGAVCLLTFPAVVVDGVIQLLQHQEAGSHLQTPRQDSATESAAEKERRPLLGYHIIAYLCCLSLWTFGAFNIRWRWKLEEVWTTACLYATDSLLTCLPNINSPLMRFLHPCWVIGSVFFALAAVLFIYWICRKCSTLQPKSPDDDTVLFRNSCRFQMFAQRDVDLSPEKNTLRDDDSAEKVIPLTLTEGIQSEGPQCRGGRVFPCPGLDVMIGVVCLLLVFVLPLNLSVNIHLIISLEKFLQWSLKYFGMTGFMPLNDTDMI